MSTIRGGVKTSVNQTAIIKIKLKSITDTVETFNTGRQCAYTTLSLKLIETASSETAMT